MKLSSKIMQCCNKIPSIYVELEIDNENIFGFSYSKNVANLATGRFRQT